MLIFMKGTGVYCMWIRRICFSFIFLIHHVSCIEKASPRSPSNDAILNDQQQRLMAQAAKEKAMREKERQESALTGLDLKTTNLRISEKKEGRNIYPQVFFNRDPKADLAQYSFCSNNKGCQTNSTLEGRGIFWDTMSGSYYVLVKSCYSSKKVSEPEKQCGPELRAEGSINQQSNSSEIQVLVEKKKILQKEIEKIGNILFSAIDKYRKAFKSCKDENPDLTPLISDEDYQKLKETDPVLLGEAIRLLLETLIEDDEEDEDDKYNPEGDINNLIWGVVGVVSSIGLMIETIVATQKEAKAKRMQGGAGKVRAGASIDGPDVKVAGNVKVKTALEASLDARKTDLDIKNKSNVEVGKKTSISQKWADMKARHKFTVIGVGALGAIGFGVMGGMAIGNMVQEGVNSKSEEDGFRLAGEKCQANDDYVMTLKEIADRVGVVTDQIRAVELEIKVESQR